MLQRSHFLVSGIKFLHRGCASVISGFIMLVRKYFLVWESGFGIGVYNAPAQPFSGVGDQVFTSGWCKIYIRDMLAFWEPLGAPGSLCEVLGASGTLSVLLGASGNVWQLAYRLAYSASWERLGASGSLWAPLGASGSVWEPLGVSGSRWEPLGLWEPTSWSLWDPLGASGVGDQVFTSGLCKFYIRVYNARPQAFSGLGIWFWDRGSQCSSAAIFWCRGSSF
jgi:hypothetical protein